MLSDETCVGDVKDANVSRREATREHLILRMETDVVRAFFRRTEVVQLKSEKQNINFDLKIATRLMRWVRCDGGGSMPAA